MATESTACSPLPPVTAPAQPLALLSNRLLPPPPAPVTPTASGLATESTACSPLPPVTAANDMQTGDLHLPDSIGAPPRDDLPQCAQCASEGLPETAAHPMTPPASLACPTDEPPHATPATAFTFTELTCPVMGCSHTYDGAKSGSITRLATHINKHHTDVRLTTTELASVGICRCPIESCGSLHGFIVASQSRTALWCHFAYKLGDGKTLDAAKHEMYFNDNGGARAVERRAIAHARAAAVPGTFGAGLPTGPPTNLTDRQIDDGLAAAADASRRNAARRVAEGDARGEGGGRAEVATELFTMAEAARYDATTTTPPPDLIHNESWLDDPNLAELCKTLDVQVVRRLNGHRSFATGLKEELYAPLACGISHWGNAGADTSLGTRGLAFFQTAFLAIFGYCKGGIAPGKVLLRQRARKAAQPGGCKQLFDELVSTCGRLEQVIGSDEAGAGGDEHDTYEATPEISAQAKNEMEMESKMRRSMHYANDGMTSKAFGVFGASPIMPSQDTKTAQLLMGKTKFGGLPKARPTSTKPPVVLKREWFDKVVPKLKDTAAPGCTLETFATHPRRAQH